MRRSIEALTTDTPSPLVTVHRLNQLIETYKFSAPHQESANQEGARLRSAVAFIWYSAVCYVAGADKTLYQFNRSLEQIQRDWRIDILTKVHSGLSEMILKEEMYELMRRVDKIETLLKKTIRDFPVSVQTTGSNLV